MKRPKSKAGTIFKSNIHEALDVLTFYSSNKAKIKPIKNIILGGLIAKVYADFENFLTDAISDHLTTLRKKEIPLSKLPKAIRGTLILNRINHNHFKNYYATSDEPKFIENLNDELPRTFSFNVDTIYRVDHAEIIKRQGYPSIDNIDIIYKRLGISNLFSQINTRVKKDSRAIINSANAVRCGFVHGSIDPNTSIGDLRIIIKNLLLFAMELDDITFKYVKSIR